jgi:hypothetical protein
MVDPLKAMMIWLFRSREFTNFTYDLSGLNQSYLISLIASILGKSFHEISSYVNELESDDELRAHIMAAIQASDERFFADLDIHYGRR